MIRWTPSDEDVDVERVRARLTMMSDAALGRPLRVFAYGHDQDAVLEPHCCLDYSLRLVPTGKLLCFLPLISPEPAWAATAWVAQIRARWTVCLRCSLRRLGTSCAAAAEEDPANCDFANSKKGCIVCCAPVAG
jgi:hypothetical protein